MASALHFSTSSHLVAAMAYLGIDEAASDDRLDYAGQFGLWLATAYATPQAVSDWREAHERFLAEGGAERWRERDAERRESKREREAASRGFAWVHGRAPVAA